MNIAHSVKALCQKVVSSRIWQMPCDDVVGESNEHSISAWYSD